MFVLCGVDVRLHTQRDCRTSKMKRSIMQNATRTVTRNNSTRNSKFHYSKSSEQICWHWYGARSKLTAPTSVIYIKQTVITHPWPLLCKREILNNLWNTRCGLSKCYKWDDLGPEGHWVLLQQPIRLKLLGLQTGVIWRAPLFHSIHVCVRAGVLSQWVVSLH